MTKNVSTGILSRNTRMHCPNEEGTKKTTLRPPSASPCWIRSFGFLHEERVRMDPVHQLITQQRVSHRCFGVVVVQPDVVDQFLADSVCKCGHQRRGLAGGLPEGDA